MPSLKISKSTLSGKLKIPPSKSHTLRALLFGAMGKGKTFIHNFLPSPDAYSMVRVLEQLGASSIIDGQTVEINGTNGIPQTCDDVLDAGNSGLVLRLAGGLASLLPTYTIITGDHSIRHNRVVFPLLTALEQLGAFATSARLDRLAPIIIKGPIKPGRATLSGEDSQPVSALLIAASFLNGKTLLHVNHPGEKPWIDLTLSWIASLGGKITNENYETYTISGGLRYDGFQTTIPGDFSSAAFPLVAALITHSELTLENLDIEDQQGDKKVLSILSKMGAKLDYDSNKKSVSVYHSPQLLGIKIDANDFIDAVPILAVAACFAQGVTEISNCAVARTKESDRLRAIAHELKKMGGNIEEREDSLRITPAPLHGAQLSSFSDHRVAMALAVAALAAKTPSMIENVACIAKSYPSFVSDFQTINANLEQIQ